MQNQSQNFAPFPSELVLGCLQQWTRLACLEPLFFHQKNPEMYFDITVHVSMSFMVFPIDILNQDVNVKS